MGFAAGSVTHKFYSRQNVPDWQELVNDIEAVAREYDRFCSNPDLVELLRLVQLDESDPVVAAIDEITSPKARDQGFIRESAIRLAIERHAMERATKHFRDLGYQVQDVHTNRPYDLLCTRGVEELMGHVPSSGVLVRHPVDVVYAAVGCGSIAGGDASRSWSSPGHAGVR